MNADVYNMQLSNEPAEALAKKLVDTSEGAFGLCGFASGGIPTLLVQESHLSCLKQDPKPWKVF